VKVLAPAFYALGSARAPMLVSIASIAINFLAAWSLTHYTRLGHAGLALATSGVSLFASVALFWILRSESPAFTAALCCAAPGRSPWPPR